MDIPDSVRKLRKRYGLTQAELGDLLGCHSMTISRWERGDHEMRAPTRALLYILLNATDGVVVEAFQMLREANKRQGR